METALRNDYKKGFVPFAFAAALVSLCGGFTASIPATIVGAWGIDGIYTTWITLAYSMGMGACAPVLGKLSDIFGRRATLMLGVALIAVGELLIGIAPVGAIVLVLAARFVVGVGAAAIAPTVISYITTEYPPTEMSKGFTLYMVLSSAMVIFGPAVGGIIVKASNWRVVMYVCAGIAAVVFIVCLMTLKKSSAPKKGLAGFDIFGGIFILVFFSLALAVPTMGQSVGWTTTSTLIVIGATVAALIILFVAEKKARSPILNGKFMARKQFIMPIVVLFLTQGLMQACMTNTIVFVMQTQPDNTIISNFSISIMYIGMTLGTLFMGPLADKREPRVVSSIALLFCALGAALQLLFKADSGFVLFAGSLFLIGLGLGGNGTIFMKVVLSGLSPEMAGAGSGTFTVFRDLSAPFGVAVFVPMFTSGMSGAIAGGAALTDAAVGSMRSVAGVQLACVIVGIIICLLLPKIHGEKK